MIRSISAWDRLVNPSFTSSPCLNWLTVTWLTMRALFLLLAGSSKKGFTCSKARRWRGRMRWQLFQMCGSRAVPLVVVSHSIWMHEAHEGRYDTSLWAAHILMHGCLPGRLIVVMPPPFTLAALPAHAEVCKQPSCAYCCEAQ